MERVDQSIHACMRACGPQLPHRRVMPACVCAWLSPGAGSAAGISHPVLTSTACMAGRQRWHGRRGPAGSGAAAHTALHATCLLAAMLAADSPECVAQASCTPVITRAAHRAVCSVGWSGCAPLRWTHLVRLGQRAKGVGGEVRRSDQQAGFRALQQRRPARRVAGGPQFSVHVMRTSADRHGVYACS